MNDEQENQNFTNLNLKYKQKKIRLIEATIEKTIAEKKILEDEYATKNNIVSLLKQNMLSFIGVSVFLATVIIPYIYVTQDSIKKESESKIQMSKKVAYDSLSEINNDSQRVLSSLDKIKSSLSDITEKLDSEIKNNTTDETAKKNLMHFSNALSTVTEELQSNIETIHQSINHSTDGIKNLN